jgi:hypothetical protein
VTKRDPASPVAPGLIVIGCITDTTPSFLELLGKLKDEFNKKHRNIHVPKKIVVINGSQKKIIPQTSDFAALGAYISDYVRVLVPDCAYLTFKLDEPSVVMTGVRRRQTLTHRRVT